MTFDDLPDVVVRYFACANGENWDGFAELWRPDAELTAFGRDRRQTRRGRDEVLAYYDGLFAPWAAHHDEVVGGAVCGEVVTAEIAFTGRTHDGRDVAFDVLDVFHLDGDRIRRLAIWHDVLHARDVLGLP